jgi:hypothetical protein
MSGIKLDPAEVERLAEVAEEAFENSESRHSAWLAVVTALLADPAVGGAIYPPCSACGEPGGPDSDVSIREGRMLCRECSLELVAGTQPIGMPLHGLTPTECYERGRREGWRAGAEEALALADEAIGDREHETQGEQCGTGCGGCEVVRLRAAIRRIEPPAYPGGAKGGEEG